VQSCQLQISSPATKEEKKFDPFKKWSWFVITNYSAVLLRMRLICPLILFGGYFVASCVDWIMIAYAGLKIIEPN